MKIIHETDIIRFVDGKLSQLSDVVTVEYSLDISLNGRAAAHLTCTPQEIEYIVLGHLVNEGLIKKAGEIVSLDIDEENGKASVVTVPSAPLKTDCKAAGAAMRFSVDGLRKNLDEFYSSSELFYTTGAVHRSALCSDNGMILDAVDISRHNTLDKLVGKALRSGIDLKACYCILSGRVHLDVVKKILVSGIPLLVSRSAPSINALEEAKLHSLGLVGFARSNRFNIYCGREMLIF